MRLRGISPGGMLGRSISLLQHKRLSVWVLLAASCLRRHGCRPGFDKQGKIHARMKNQQTQHHPTASTISTAMGD